MTGAFRGLHPLRNGNTFISLEIDGDYAEILESLQENKLDIDIMKHKEKRSNNANAYFYVLCEKIAQEMGLSKTEVCNLMIAKYGQVDNEAGFVIIRDDINYLERKDVHLRPTSKTQIMNDGKLYRCYRVMRPSHTYNKREFGALIQGVQKETTGICEFR